MRWAPCGGSGATRSRCARARRRRTGRARPTTAPAVPPGTTAAAPPARRGARSPIDAERRRQDVPGGRLRGFEELAEEAPLRQQLVLQDVGDGARARVWPVGEVGVREAAPDSGHLVGLAGVGVEDVLQGQRHGPRDALVRDGDVGIVHAGQPPAAAPQPTRLRTCSAARTAPCAAPPDRPSAWR